MGIYLPKIFIFERILKFFSKKFGSLKNIRTFAIPNGKNAEIAQLVEHTLPQRNKVFNLGKNEQNLRAN